MLFLLRLIVIDAIMTAFQFGLWSLNSELEPEPRIMAITPYFITAFSSAMEGFVPEISVRCLNTTIREKNTKITIEQYTQTLQVKFIYIIYSDET